MSTIVITGCSSGFGLQAALAFARNGDKVYATMRNPERSKSLLAAAATENLNIHIKQLDVNKSDTYNAVFDEIIKESNTIDVLVNNAGILRDGSFQVNILMGDALGLYSCHAVSFVTPLPLPRSPLHALSSTTLLFPCAPRK